MSDERRPDLDNIKEFWRAAYMYVDDDDDDGALGPPSHYVATVYRYIVLPNPTFLLRHSIADFFVREGEIREKIHKDSNATWNIVTWENEFIRKPTDDDDDPLHYVVFLNKEQAIEEGRNMAGYRRDEIEENEKRKKGSSDLLEALDNLTLEETSEKTSEDNRRKHRWWRMDQ